MKCPKCGYLGFEHIERCRNCGYDFLLSRSAGLSDLQIRQAPAEPNPLGDLEFVDRALNQSEPLNLSMNAPGRVEPADPAVPEARSAPPVAPAPSAPPPMMVRPKLVARRASAAAVALDTPPPASNAPPPQAPLSPAPPVPLASGAPAPAASVTSSRLPLFSPAQNDDLPLITHPSPPRQPLAVRRATPEVPRLRGESPRSASLDLPLEPRPEPSRAVDRHAAHTFVTPDSAQAHIEDEPAGIGARVSAVIVDLLILATIDAAVIYFTMQICAVSLSEFAIVPKAPLLAFLLVQNGGYLVAFTAGGQTLGKMAAGIKVIPDSGGTLDVGRALLRTLLWFLLAIPAGLGFVSAFFGREHRGLHDRFAGTRVVRASA